MLSHEVDSAFFSTLLPLGDQLVTEMGSQPKFLPVFIDYFQCLVLLAGRGDTRGHLMLARTVEKWFPECLARFNEETDAALLLKPQVSGHVAAMLQYLGQLYSAVLFATDMLMYNEKRKFADEEDSPLLVRVMYREYIQMYCTYGGILSASSCSRSLSMVCLPPGI